MNNTKALITTIDFTDPAFTSYLEVSRNETFIVMSISIVVLILTIGISFKFLKKLRTYFELAIIPPVIILLCLLFIVVGTYELYLINHHPEVYILRNLYSIKH